MARSRLIGPKPGNPHPTLPIHCSGLGRAWLTFISTAKILLLTTEFDGLGVQRMYSHSEGRQFDPAPEPKYLDTFTAKSVAHREKDR